VCVFITAVPITKLFAWGEGIVEDMCYERRREEGDGDRPGRGGTKPETTVGPQLVHLCQNHFGLMRACTAAREANVQVCLPTCRASSCSSVLLLDTSTLSPKADISQAPHLCIRGGPCRGNGVVGPELVARRPMKLGCYGGRWTPRCWTTRYSPATLRYR